MRTKLPKIGDTRVRKKFVWFPIITDDKFKVWFEHVIVEEVVEEYQGRARWLRSSRNSMEKSPALDMILK